MENNANRYKIDRKIRENKFFTVYKAYDNILTREVSLKKYNDKDYFGEISDKLQLVAKLHHPYILEIYDLFSDGENNGILTYEFFQGLYLDEYLSRYNLEEEKIMSLLQKILVSFLYVENNEIYCGKFDLNNILINQNESIKLNLVDKIHDDNIENKQFQLKFNEALILEVLQKSGIDVENSIFKDFQNDLKNNSFENTSEILKGLNSVGQKPKHKATEDKDNTIILDIKDNKTNYEPISYAIDEDAFVEDNPSVKKKSGSIVKSVLVYITSILLAFIVAAAMIFYYNLRPKAPDYTEKNLQLALDQATKDGIEIVVDKSFNVDKTNFRKYVVVSQSPKAGRKLLFRNKVKVELGLEKDKTMINVIGKDLKSAEKQISDIGLNVKKIKYTKSNVYDKGIVVDQSLDAGRKIEDGDFVTLTVSSGRKVRNENEENEDEEYTPPEENERPQEDENSQDSNETDNSNQNPDNQSDNNTNNDSNNNVNNPNNDGE